MRFVLAAVALLAACVLSGVSASAAEQCPKGYFRADASNQIAGTNAALNPSVCVMMTTAPTRIDMKVIVLANVTNVRTLEDRVLQGLGGSADCGGLFSVNSLMSAGGWDVSEIKLSFIRSPAAAKIHGSAKVKVCNAATAIANAIGGTFQLDALLGYKFDNNVLTFQLDENSLKLKPALANDYRAKIYSVFNAALSQYAFSPYNYLPAKLRPYMQDLSPSIDRARLQVDQDHLQLRVEMSGTLTKASADDELKNATSGWTVDDIINFLKSHFNVGSS
jgi:hypothetical protein